MKPTRGLVYFALAVAVALAMGLSLRNGFVYDDVPAIATNPRVTDPAQWHLIPRSPYWLGTLWRPLTVALFAAQWFVGHGAPWFFHLVSLLGYLAVGVLLFHLIERVGSSPGIADGAAVAPGVPPTASISRFAAAAATVLFLVHPVHVEVVANGVGQAEIWVALALLGGTLVYLRARRNGTERRSLPLLLLIVVLGITAKEQGFIAPLLLAGAEWLLLSDRQEPLRARIRLLLPVVALVVLMFVVRATLLNSAAGETPAEALRGLDPPGRFVTLLAVIPEWARLAVWPLHLQADYGPPGIPVGGPMSVRHWIGLVLLIGCLALFVRCRKRAPGVAFGLLWTAIALAPVSNLLTPTGIVMAERVLFVPTIGLAIAAAGVAWQGERRSARSVMVASLAVAWGVLLTVRSATRVPTWSTQERFYSDMVVDAPRAYRGWLVAAKYWDDAHDQPRAIAELERARVLWPHDYGVFERLGQIYRQGGRCDMAIPEFKAGLQQDSLATSLRAKLVECLIVARDWDGADKTASDGVALGQQEFESMLTRVRRLRAASDSAGGH